MYKGTYTALITPFRKDLVDENGLVENIRFQIANGIDGIVALGTTGESQALSGEERRQVIRICVKESKGKVPVIVGTGHNITAKALELTKNAENLGADVALIVAPYYNKPTQEGIYHHYASIAQQVDIPILIYNVPSRTGVNIEVSTLVRLAQYPTIIGIKEASGQIGQAVDMIHAMKAERPDFAVLCGDDALTLPMMALGASGVVSVVSNVVPGLLSALVGACRKGDFDEARQWHNQLLPLMKVLFIESNPSPVKAAMQLCGMAAGNCRLPLCSMRPENRQLLKSVLNSMNLL